MKNLQNRLNKLLLAVLMIASIVADAQVDPPSYLFKEKVVSGTTTFTALEIDKPIGPGALLNEKTTSVKLYLKLDLGEDYVEVVQSPSFTYSVVVDVNLYTNMNVLIRTIQETLEIGDNLASSTVNVEMVKEVDLIIDFNLGNLDHIEIVPSAPAFPAATPALLNNYINANNEITATLIREYGVDVRLSANNTMAPGLLMQLNPDASISTGRLLKFMWGTNSTENFPNYEVQILRLYNTDQNMATSNSSITAAIDWNKALRVETQSAEKEITLTVAEGSGFYVWRVRPIGNFYAGGIANQQNYGVWNTSSLIQGSSITLEQTTIGSRKDAFYVTDPDENINWIYNRVFTEGDRAKTDVEGVKTSEGMSYADGLLRARQTQAYNSSTIQYKFDNTNGK